MISRYEAILNGVPLSTLSGNILILDIKYNSPSINNETYSVAKKQGERIHRRYLNKSSVTIDFAIREYDIRERQVICSEIVKWAKNGGILQTNDRTGQRLRCVCETFPVISSALKWTDTLSIVFSAYALPYWEEEIPSTLTLTGSNTNGTLYVPGNVDGAFVEASIKANATLSTINLWCNNRTIALANISVASGQTIVISYDYEMIQSIKVGNTSLLDKRVGVDDLLANCGETNSMAVVANASVTVTYSVRGLWL